MTIDEAITHAPEVAEGCPAEDRQCAFQHDELAGWLEELKAYLTRYGWNAAPCVYVKRIDKEAALYVDAAA